MLRPKIVKMDCEATLRIREKYEREVDAEYASQEVKMARAARIRRRFTKNVAPKRLRFGSSGREPPFSLGRTGDLDPTLNPEARRENENS